MTWVYGLALIAITYTDYATAVIPAFNSGIRKLFYLSSMQPV